MSQRRAQATRGGGGLRRAYFQWRYAILFYSLLLTLAVGPLRSALGFRASLLELFLAINLLVAVLPIGGRRTRLFFLTIVAAVLALRGGAAWFDNAGLSTTSLALWTVAAPVAAANALRFALGATVVNREHLYAALSAYVLAGLFFGVFYWVLEQTWPGSLGTAGESVPGQLPADAGDLLQLRHAGDAWLRRHCASQRGGARPGHHGGRRGSTLPRRDDRASGEPLHLRGRQGQPA